MVSQVLSWLPSCQTQWHSRSIVPNFFSVSNYRVHFLTGPSKIFLRVRLHSKSHQKSSKCQNLLTGWHLEKSCQDQLKNAPCIFPYWDPKFQMKYKYFCTENGCIITWCKPLADQIMYAKFPELNIQTQPLDFLRLRSLSCQRFIFNRMR